MEELLKFKDLCACEIAKANVAGKEAAKRIQIIGEIPAELRDLAEWPRDSADVKVLAANAESAASKITNFVEQVQLTWIAHAETFDNTKHNWGVEEKMEDWGLLRQLASHDTYLINKS